MLGYRLEFCSGIGIEHPMCRESRVGVDAVVLWCAHRLAAAVFVQLLTVAAVWFCLARAIATRLWSVVTFVER